MGVGDPKDVEYFLELLGEKVFKSSPVVVRMKPSSVKDTKILKEFVDSLREAPNVRIEVDL